MFPHVRGIDGSDPREGGPRLGDERTTLTEFLRCQRLRERTAGRVGQWLRPPRGRA